MTLGNAAAAKVRLIVWCLPFGEPRLRRASRLRPEPHGFAGCPDCRHQVEPAAASLRAAEDGIGADPVEMGQQYDPATTVPEWRKRRR